MANYDAIFVLTAGLSDEKIDSIISRFEKKIVDNEGTAGKVEKWGTKRLNFEFKRYKGVKEGFYALLPFSGTGKTVSALSEIMRLQEEVIRQIITKANEVKPSGAEEAVVFPDISEVMPSGQPQ